jgi:glutaminase
VGVEPTGEAFNSIVLDEKNNRPFNPMVNAGAIAVSGLVTGSDAAARRAAMLEMFGAFAGRPLAIDEAVYRSELATGHRNRAIAYLMLNSGMISGDAEAILDLYFRQCSVLVTARDLAVMAATLANDGVNPVTGARVLGSEHVRDVLSVMTTCGMYDYAGQWAFEVGMPAKSGVSGAIIAVVPGQVGLCAFSPPLDAVGNSVRGVRLFQRMSREFGLHTHGSRPNEVAVIRRAIRGDAVHSKRVRTPREAGTLEREGHRIAELELQGRCSSGPPNG